jgi:N-acyl-D-aspartate/D-glutamate deacylase
MSLFSRRLSLLLAVPWLSILLVLVAALTALTARPSARAGAAEEEPYDLILLGARVIDGTGNPWSAGDVAIRGDRIAAVGRLPHQDARRTIACRGLVVAPGFIDMHSHSDFLLLEDGDAQSKVRQGVTTEVLGEDSSGGPSKGKLPPASVELRGERVEWSTLGGYFAALERGGTAVNVASYVGLGQVWRCIKGHDFDRPSPSELAAMHALIAEAMEDGAWGLSSMLMVPPGMLATPDDLVEMCRVVRRYGGIFSSHIRTEGTGVLDSIREVIAVGEGARVPVDVIHIKIADQKLWGRMADVILLIEEARGRGVDVEANVYPYTRGNNDLATIIPPWAHEGGKGALIARLKDPEARARIRREILVESPDWYNHYLAVGGDWSRVLVNADLSAGNKALEGLTMKEIVALRTQEGGGGRDGIDVLFDLLVEEGGAVSAIYAHHTEEDMNLVLSRPWCSIGSDGSAYATEGPLRRGKPHPRSFGTFPRVLGVYVRERRLLGLEDAVRKMTSLNAAKLGITDRGVLRSGAFADVVVFDPERVIDRATYLEPFHYGEGIEHVIVNGQVVLEGGKHTGARPGRVLRRSGAPRAGGGDDGR